MGGSPNTPRGTRKMVHLPHQSSLRRWLKHGAVALLAFLLVVLVPLAFIIYPVFKPYPAADFPPAHLQAEKNAQDLAYLRHLPQIDRSFTAENRAAFERALDELAARSQDLDKAALAMGAARAVALADNGHTNVLGLVGGRGFNAVPFRLGWFADGLYVVSAAADDADLLGAQILALNGRSPEQLVEALRPYVGGSPVFARELSPNFMISPALLHAAGLTGDPDKSALVVRERSGTVSARTFVAVPGTPEGLERNFWPKRDWSPVPQPGRNGWVHVLDGIALPPYLSRPDQNYWHDYLEKDDILYVQFNRVQDQGPASVSDYLSNVLEEARTRKVKNAVVDLRFNAGGNYLLAVDFSRQLPTIVPPDGKIFILTSGNTFSAAISTASRLKYYAGSRAVLIGEVMGDRGQSWGEGGTAFLPNSKIAVRYATAYHDWENGCRLSQLRTCFFLNYLYGTAAGSLLPTVRLSPTFARYAAGEDAVMEEVLRLAGNARMSGEPGSSKPRSE